MSEECLDFDDVVSRAVRVQNIRDASGETVKGKDGQPQKFVLREATQGAILKYQEANLGLFQRVVDNDDGTTTVRQVKVGRSTDALLVSLCLFEEDSGEQVLLKTVQGWPARIQRQLFEKAEDISDLDDEGALPSLLVTRERVNKRIAKLEAAAKNCQPAAD